MDSSHSGLVGSWIHSHEEDSDGNLVFRRSGSEMHPSRGRIGFDLRADGTAELIGIAATDGLTIATATWSMDDAGNVRIVPEDEKTQTWPVVEIDDDRLILSPPRSG